jgi:hypothetical protein
MRADLRMKCESSALQDCAFARGREPNHQHRLMPAIYLDAIGLGVTEISEYKKNAQECRTLAKQMPPGPQREQLFAMADTWDQLAVNREAALRRQKRHGRLPSHEAS